MDPQVEALQGQVAELRRQVAALQRIARPAEAPHVRLPGSIRIVRINQAHDGSEEGGGIPARYYSGFVQKVYPYIAADPEADPPVEEDLGGIRDDTFEVQAIVRTTHSPWLGKFSQDVAVASVDHFDVVLPMQAMVPVIIGAAEAAAPFGADGQFADVEAAADGTPAGFGDVLPVLCANAAEYYDGPPFSPDRVYPGIHLFPPTEVNGEGETVSTIGGVDPTKGFFLCFPEPRGSIETTHTLETKLGAGDGLSREVTITTEIDVDSAGRIRAITHGRSPAYTPP